MAFRALLVAVSLCASSAALAGPLTPPVGPVAPTHKTLSELEPRTIINLTNTPGDSNSLFRIAAPGSYYLTSSVTGVAAKHGIEIAADGVTIDLNGFELIGVSGSLSGVTSGVSIVRNLVIKNGTIRNWGEFGVYFLSTNHTALHFDHLFLTSNGNSAISCGATACTVTHCTATDNSGTGISVGGDSHVSNCVTRNNTDSGIFTSIGSTITSCSAQLNGDYGIVTGAGSAVSNCSAHSNVLDGISASAGATLTNCGAISNGRHGIGASSGVSILNCTASSNSMNGFDVGDACLVEHCVARSNTLDGIQCDSHCVIRDNICFANAAGAEIGAGVHVNENNTRVEGNNCTNNDFGVHIAGDGNVIIRNTCADNTQNFVIVANNIFGAIVNRIAPASSPVAGNSATSTMGSTDPHANFAY